MQIIEDENGHLIFGDSINTWETLELFLLNNAY